MSRTTTMGVDVETSGLVARAWHWLCSKSETKSVQQHWCFIEYIPSSLGDVMREVEVPGSAGSGGQNPGLAQTIDDTVVQAKILGARLLAYVEPQNLLFFFGETAQALGHAQITIPLGAVCTHLCDHPVTGLDRNNGATGKKPHADDCAIVFCQVSNTKALEKCRVAKKQNSKQHGDCYQVAWGELEGLKHMLQNFGGHSQSVGGAA